MTRMEAERYAIGANVNAPRGTMYAAKKAATGEWYVGRYVSGWLIDRIYSESVKA